VSQSDGVRRCFSPPLSLPRKARFQTFLDPLFFSFFSSFANPNSFFFHTSPCYFPSRSLRFAYISFSFFFHFCVPCFSPRRVFPPSGPFRFSLYFLRFTSSVGYHRVSYRLASRSGWELVVGVGCKGRSAPSPGRQLLVIPSVSRERWELDGAYLP